MHRREDPTIDAEREMELRRQYEELRAEYGAKDDHDNIVETVVTVKALARTVDNCVSVDQDHENRLTVIETHWRIFCAFTALVGAAAVIIVADIMMRLWT